jgi:hypothetical protein
VLATTSTNVTAPEERFRNTLSFTFELQITRFFPTIAFLEVDALRQFLDSLWDVGFRQ